MSQAGSPSDGVTIDLRAQDAGAAAALGNLQSSLGGIVESAQGIKAMAASLGGLYAAVRLTFEAMQEFDQAAQSVERLQMQLDKLGTEGVAAIKKINAPELSGLDKVVEQIKETTKKTQDALSAELLQERKKRTDFSLEGIKARIEVAFGLIEPLADIEKKIGETQKNVAKESDTEVTEARKIAAERRAKAEADAIKSASAELLDAQIAASEGAIKYSLQRGKAAIEEEAALREAKSEQEKRLIEAAYAARIAGINAAEKRELEAQAKAAEAERKRLEEKARENEREFQRQQNRNAASALANSMWAGAPDFFSAANDGVTMDLLIRTGRN